jgi:hypothetical protein
LSSPSSSPRNWFGLWAVAFYLTALGYVWMVQGKNLLAILAVVSVIGLMVSLVAMALQTRR